jgi:hypothetical protein
MARFQNGRPSDQRDAQEVVLADRCGGAQAGGEVLVSMHGSTGDWTCNCTNASAE